MSSRFDQPDDDSERGLRPETIRRSCANCQGDVFVGRHEPWTLVVWCELCQEQAMTWPSRTVEPDPRD